MKRLAAFTALSITMLLGAIPSAAAASSAPAAQVRSCYIVTLLGQTYTLCTP
jgi:hypothetical protein